MKCVCCGAEMDKVNESRKWYFYKCSHCHFWSSRDKKGDFPQYDYMDAPTFDRNHSSDWDELVRESVTIMKYKFDYAGKSDVKGAFLDVGCSEGPYVAAAQLLGWEAVGFEVDKAKVARGEVKGLIIMEPCYEIYGGGDFDFIMLRHSIEHIPDFMGVLKKCYKLLKTNGVICIETPNQGSLKSILTRNKILDERYCGHLYPPTHINGFERKTYKEMAKALGLEIISIKTYSPTDKKWTAASLWKGSYIKKMIHSFAAATGVGENIAVFLKKSI